MPLCLRPLVLALAAALLACGSAQPPSLLLVTLDTTRADRLGAYGYDAASTPTLDRLAREGIVFETAIAPTPITLPSHASILTGVYPPSHGVRDNELFALAPEAQLVSEVLREEGWRTGAFVGAFVLDAHFGLDQGFEVYRAPLGQPLGEDPQVERPADEVVDDAIEWLDTLSSGERFFAWVHLFDPHLPYQPPPPWNTRLPDPYDGEIAFSDAQLGRLLDFIEDAGLGGNLRVLVTADHGESLGEHGETSHGVLVYQATLRVPLILWGDSLAGAGTRVEPPVTTAAVPATLLQLAGVGSGAMPQLQGPSLVRGADGAPASAAAQPIYVESLLPYHSFRWRAMRGLVSGEFKLIEGRRPELYALADDPDELQDLALSEPERLGRLRAELAAWQAQHAALEWDSRPDLDAGEREMLRSLGYLTQSEGEDPFAPGLPDARERITDVEQITRAERHMRRAAKLLPLDPEKRVAQSARRRARGVRELERARDLLLAVRAENPEDPHVFSDLGVVESELGNHGEAVPLLERAVAQRPGIPLLRFHLALSYEALGRRDDARREMKAALELNPKAVLFARWLREHPPRQGLKPH